MKALLKLNLLRPQLIYFGMVTIAAASCAGLISQSRFTLYTLAFAMSAAGIFAGLALVYHRPRLSLLRARLFSYYLPFLITIVFYSLPFTYLSSIAYLSILLGSVHSYKSMGYLTQALRIRIPPSVTILAATLSLVTLIQTGLYPQTYLTSERLLIGFHLLPVGGHIIAFAATCLLQPKAASSQLLTYGPSLVSLVGISCLLLFSSQYGHLVLTVLALNFLYESRLFKQHNPRLTRGERGLIKKLPAPQAPSFTLESFANNLSRICWRQQLTIDQDRYKVEIRGNQTALVAMISNLITRPEYLECQFRLHFYQSFYQGEPYHWLDLQGVGRPQRAENYTHPAARTIKQIERLGHEMGFSLVNQSLALSPPLYAIALAPTGELPHRSFTSEVSSASAAAAFVLIVDDERTIVDLYAEALARDGIHILKAYDGVEAAKLYRRFAPVCVITDIMLPKKNGLDLIRLIRNGPSAAAVISVSGHADPRLLQQSMDLGCLAAHSKPPKLGALAAQVEQVIARAQQSAA